MTRQEAADLWLALAELRGVERTPMYRVSLLPQTLALRGNASIRYRVQVESHSGAAWERAIEVAQKTRPGVQLEPTADGLIFR